jgi:acetylglutamate kinase
MKTSEVLIDALEYIRKFRGCLFVIKLGGEIILDEKMLDAVAQDVILLNCVNIKPVIVHGGGPDISTAMKKFGKEPTFVDGLRVTDEETMDIVKMVLIGKINTAIVGRINKFGGNAVGISGKSGRLFSAKKHKGKVDLGFVGDVSDVNSELVGVLLDKNYIPVISPIGFDSEGNSLNINADTAAAKLAASLKADKMIFLTATGGVFDKKGKLIPKLTIKEAKDLIKKGVATGGMIPKLEACMEAVTSGVAGAHIIGARQHSIVEEVFTSSGIGTMVTKK